MNIAVVFAGGVGHRMNSKDKPKQFLEMHNKPIIIHTLEHFDNNANIDAIVISCVSEWMDYLNELINKFNIKKVKKIVPGGKTGQLSIYNGLKAAQEIASNDKDIVLIHDGVRPFINDKLIDDNINAVKEYGSAITTSPVTETILVVKEDTSEISYVPSRKDSRVAKAPQSFYLSDILSLHEKALKDGIENSIDSCTLAQKFGVKLFLVDGPDENIKITTPRDFYIMRAMLDAKENAQIYGIEED